MTNKVLLYPSLNEKIMEKISFKNKDFVFFYNALDGNEYELDNEPIETSSGINVLQDERGMWNADEYNLGFIKKYYIDDNQYFFGENGLACKDATLGIAIIWKSSDSKQRGAIPVTSFKINETIKDVCVSWKFEKAQLRGRVDLATVLYIAKEGVPNKNELHLANTQGYILGEFDEYTIMLDGTSSSLPIFEVTEPEQALWYVKCEWNDPTIDKFEDYVSINLNKAHEAYKYIDRTHKKFNSQLLAEIIASAIALIIEKLRSDNMYWDDILKNEKLEDGSVGQAIFYFYETHKWDLSTPESTSLSARKFFEQGMRDL